VIPDILSPSLLESILGTAAAHDAPTEVHLFDGAGRFLEKITA
jgi:hypothetical protein